MRLLIGWAINALALMALPYLMSTVQIKSFGTALVVALVIGLLNTFVRPILFILTLPINLLTLGLFTFVLNGFTKGDWLQAFLFALSVAWASQVRMMRTGAVGVPQSSRVSPTSTTRATSPTTSATRTPCSWTTSRC